MGDNIEPEFDAELLDAVARLPETYQPIYGRPEIRGSRHADLERVEIVVFAVDRLAERMGRRLHVLDLGTAQGYVTFRLAEHGHEVVGIDIEEPNVEVARLLAGRHPDLRASFVHGDVERAAELVDLGGFDVVVGLSVLHHVAYRSGPDAALGLVGRLAEAVPNGIYEMALRSEPLYWATAQPENPHVFLAPYPFSRVIGESPTHLSPIRRPVLFCSSRYAWLPDELAEIESWSARSHDGDMGVHDKTLRYFSIPRRVMKVATMYEHDSPADVLRAVSDELRRESNVLPVLHAAGYASPACCEFSLNAYETILVRESYEGTILSDLVDGLDSSQRTFVTSEVLARLSELERHGFFHTDLRTWNVIVDMPSKAVHLIDFGSLATEPNDVVWPHDAYFSTIVFLARLWSGRPDQTGVPIPRSLAVDSSELPAPVVALISFALGRARTPGFFADLAGVWAEIDLAAPGPWPAVPMSWAWLVAAEEGRASAIRRIGEFEAHVESLEHTIAVVSADGEASRSALAHARTVLAGLESERDVLDGRLAVLRAEETELAERFVAVAAELDRARAVASAEAEGRSHVEREIELMRDTISWRITRPIRWLRSRL